MNINKTGLLNKFRNRHGIRNLSIPGEKLSAAEETVDPLQKLHRVVEDRGLTPKQTLQCWRDLTFREMFAAKNSSFQS